MEAHVEIAHVFVVKAMLENTVKSQFAKNSVKMGADVLALIGVLVFTDTQADTAKLITELDLVSEELTMICVQDNWKGLYVQNSCVVQLLEKHGVTHVNLVLINCPVKKDS